MTRTARILIMVWPLVGIAAAVVGIMIGQADPFNQRPAPQPTPSYTVGDGQWQ